jgi:ATP-dependent RNA helicase DDX24/MAK5
MLDKLKTRVQLARRIENTRHKIKKTNHNRKWMKETAETLGVDLELDLIRYLKKKQTLFFGYSYCFISNSDDEGKISSQKRRAKNSAMSSMKAELKYLLSQPLIARGISTRYITSGSRLIVDDLLAGNRESSE